MTRELTKELLGTIQPLVTGRSITYAGSKAAHDAFETLQQQLEASCEQYRQLCQTNRETLTPSTSAALKAEQEELFFSICRQAEILLEDRRALLTDAISAASGGTWLQSQVSVEMDKAQQHLSVIGLTPEAMVAFPSNPQVARRQLDGFIYCTPAVREAAREHKKRTELFKLLRADLASLDARVDAVHALSIKTVSA